MLGAKPLQYTTEVLEDGTRVFRLRGDLHGGDTAYDFQELVRRAVAEGTRRVVVDLGHAERIDSSGVGILASIAFSTSKAGGGLVLAALPGRIERILGLAMLLDHIARADDVEAALAKLDAMSA